MLDHGAASRIATGDPPLLLTTDSSISDDVCRAAAAAGVTVGHRRASDDVRGAWSRAAAVVVGVDQLGPVIALALPRRGRVYVVGRRDTGGLPDDATWLGGALGIGAEAVLSLPADAAALAERLADSIEARTDPALILATIGGRGGAGATTLAVAIALRGSARAMNVALVDADPLSGGIDLAVGCEDEPGYRWPALARSCGRVDGSAVLDALPRARHVAVLSHERRALADVGPDAMSAVLAALSRACDLVVVDLPRSIAPSAAAALHATARTYLVVPAEVRATASAARLAAEIHSLTPDLRLVVREPGLASLSANTMATAVGISLAAEGRSDPRVARALEIGELPGRRARSPLARLADRVLDDAVAR
jgi:secretion/DNA translocation related CpaE-like protein